MGIPVADVLAQKLGSYGPADRGVDTDRSVESAMATGRPSNWTAAERRSAWSTRLASSRDHAHSAAGGLSSARESLLGGDGAWADGAGHGPVGGGAPQFSGGEAAQQAQATPQQDRQNNQPPPPSGAPAVAGHRDMADTVGRHRAGFTEGGADMQAELRFTKCVSWALALTAHAGWCRVSYEYRTSVAPSIVAIAIVGC